jgi:hypothetical protein
MAKKLTTFILNDETQENSYGFTIPNSGIDLTQFEANPVMLNSHLNSTEDVIGRWVNIRIEGSQLLADAEFDTEDEVAKKIEGKVSRGFLKGVSMGVGFFVEDMKYVGGKFLLLKCVLKESSIVAVPSNAKAVVLYDLATGLLFADEQLNLQLSDLKNLQNENKTSMKQIMLSATALVALGLTAQPSSESELDASVLKLKAELDAEKVKSIASVKELGEKLKTAEDALLAQVKLQSKALLDGAISEGKITAEERATFEALPLEVATSTLAKIPAKATLGSLITGGNATGTEPKTFEDLFSLSDEARATFKETNPAAYNKLVNA